MEGCGNHALYIEIPLNEPSRRHNNRQPTEVEPSKQERLNKLNLKASHRRAALEAACLDELIANPTPLLYSRETPCSHELVTRSERTTHRSH